MCVQSVSQAVGRRGTSFSGCRAERGGAPVSIKVSVSVATETLILTYTYIHGGRGQGHHRKTQNALLLRLSKKQAALLEVPLITYSTLLTDV